MSKILPLLGLTPSERSVDYVENRSQFHLFNLVTEQRHGATWNLSFALQSDTEAGLRMLLDVDRDITQRLAGLIEDPSALEQAVCSIVGAVRAGRRIYFYGCGATGRLAKQMESSFWRPFWRRVQASECWPKLQPDLPPDIEELVVGEMTGGDRALVSSLEGFEDLPLVGALQLADHGISRGDVVICVTEGGETSSVIGTMLAALESYQGGDVPEGERARHHLYFVYNNPDEVLLPFERSAAVLRHPSMTRINLATGPQAITGSTRMQATTIETFVLGAVLEEALVRVLREHLEPAELAALGFHGDPGLAGRLATFESLRQAVVQTLPSLASFTEYEAEVYRRGRLSTYCARQAMITVFIDNTERSPTFSLFPLDRVELPERRCWVQVWTEAADARAAWSRFLGRPFRGLEHSFYHARLEQEVADPYLRQAALRSLANAGSEEMDAYDFSFSPDNVARRGPAPGDQGVLVLMDDELDELARSDSMAHAFRALVREHDASHTLVAVSGPERTASLKRRWRELDDGDRLVHLVVETDEDPLGLRRQIGLKMLLNAHSTAVMASLGRVVGNTMTAVSPSNLKLVGRATWLILSHVNDALAQPAWRAKHGESSALTFAEANAVLFDAIDYVAGQAIAQTAEVALGIIRILEALDRNAPITWDEAHRLLEAEGLAAYLARQNPALAATPRAR